MHIYIVMKTTEKTIKEANREGLLDGSYAPAPYRTPVYAVAYRLGQDGVDLQDTEVVTGYRYGEPPESGISTNYRENTSERGLSLAALDGDKPVGSVMFFWGRDKIKVIGLLLPYMGSDGEPLILMIGADDFDHWDE